MPRSKKTFHLLMFTAITLLLSLLVPIFQNEAKAQVTVGNTNPYGGTVYPPEQGVSYVEPNTTHNLPSIGQNGTTINPSAHPYTWSTADSSIATVNTLTVPYTYTAGVSYRETTLTATYMGESASFTVKIRELSKFNGRPTVNGLAAIPPLFPGLTTGFAVTGLSDLDTNGPINNGSLSFYDSYKNAGGNLLCTATTDTSGSGSCSVLKLQYYNFFCVYFAGNLVYAPKYTCNVD